MLLRGLVVVALALPAGCNTPHALVEEDLGRIEDVVLDPAPWPGVDSGLGRIVPRINGFASGQPVGCWLVGDGVRQTSSAFWFCREGDTACPLDGTGALDPSRTVGAPVLQTVPGDPDHATAWVVWVVDVPADYAAESLKSVQGILDAASTGHVEVRELRWGHGSEAGVDLAIANLLPVLQGTALDQDGQALLGTPEVRAEEVPLRQGWHARRQVDFYDFTAIEGVFAPDPNSETVPRLPHGDVFLPYRDCLGGSTAPSCLSGTVWQGAVAEPLVGIDLTGDGDQADANAVFSGFPAIPPALEGDLPYSSLWRVQRVLVPVSSDAEVDLIDSTMGQDDTMISSTADIVALVEAGLVLPAEPVAEQPEASPVPGNEGLVHLACPGQVGPR